MNDRSALIRQLIECWRLDDDASYRSWFLWEERLKNFRSIRRGIQQIVAEIAAGSFGVAYRGSSLETVVHSIAEQRQIFKGADHAFLWKPKLRIPDIYENPANQRAFGRLLDNCLCCGSADDVIKQIRTITSSALPQQRQLSSRFARSTRCAFGGSGRPSPTCSISSTRH